jgi:hypothetical protein
MAKTLVEFVGEKPIFSYKKREWLSDDGASNISGHIRVRPHDLDACIKISNEYGDPLRIDLNIFGEDCCEEKVKKLKVIVDFLKSFESKYNKACKEYEAEVSRAKESNPDNALTGAKY